MSGRGGLYKGPNGENLYGDGTELATAAHPEAVDRAQEHELTCEDCDGTGLDAGSLHEPEPCPTCDGTGAEPRRIGERHMAGSTGPDSGPVIQEDIWLRDGLDSTDED